MAYKIHKLQFQIKKKIILLTRFDKLSFQGGCSADRQMEWEGHSGKFHPSNGLILIYLTMDYIYICHFHVYIKWLELHFSAY